MYTYLNSEVAASY